MAVGDLVSTLTDILVERTREKPADGGEQLDLREPGAHMRVKVTALPSNLIAIRISRIGHSSALRQEPASDWNKRCDYVLLNDLGDRCNVVLVELKKTLNAKKVAAEQLRRSLPIVKYLLSVCEVERGRAWPMSVHYALIAEKQGRLLDKQRTRQPSAFLTTEHFDGVDVAVFVGTTFSAAQLAASPASGQAPAT